MTDTVLAADLKDDDPVRAAADGTLCRGLVCTIGLLLCLSQPIVFAAYGEYSESWWVLLLAELLIVLMRNMVCFGLERFRCVL